MAAHTVRFSLSSLSPHPDQKAKNRGGPRFRFAKSLYEDLPDDPVESIKHPSAAITKVLASVKQVYRKRAEDAHKIVDRLDFDALYNDKAANVAALGQLVEALDNAVGA